MHSGSLALFPSEGEKSKNETNHRLLVRVYTAKRQQLEKAYSCTKPMRALNVADSRHTLKLLQK